MMLSEEVARRLRRELEVVYWRRVNMDADLKCINAEIVIRLARIEALKTLIAECIS